MGIEDVQFASIQNFETRMSNSPTPPPKNAKSWKVKRVRQLGMNPEDLSEVLSQPATERAARGKKAWIIDVRTEREYFNRKGRGYPDVNALHIPWTEFLTDKGRPNWRIKTRLLEYGISPNHTIVLISESGLRSAAATASLLSLGFGGATNAFGGYTQLFRKSRF